MESDEEMETTEDTVTCESNLMRMKISCWNVNAKTYRKKLPIELLGKKENQIKEICGIENILMVNRERTSALSKDLTSLLGLAEYSLFR